MDSFIGEFGDVLQDFADLLTHELCHLGLLPLALRLGHFIRSHLLEKRWGIVVINVHAVAVFVVPGIGIIHLDVIRAVLHQAIVDGYAVHGAPCAVVPLDHCQDLLGAEPAGTERLVLPDEAHAQEAVPLVPADVGAVLAQLGLDPDH
ncbi:unnamed protein product [Clonostachys chloroleuca]|uniref:Uncharacterized protein n=1 Tax=Clonostachys chloroleuca TaxID=1926264 RepID=A0AA35QEF9_9HYPO|nr:unnamed protein product [Clonostachys chloroleuca]